MSGVNGRAVFTWQNRTDLGKCTHLYDETQGNKETLVLLTENYLLQVQEDRWLIIKEEGNKEERQDGADSLIPRLPGKSSARV